MKDLERLVLFRICRYLMLPAFLGFGNSLMANVQVANLKQDLELIAREVASLRSEVELLRRENAQLRVALEQVNVSAKAGNDQAAISQLEGRVRVVEQKASANEQARSELQNNFNGKIGELIRQMNDGFSKVTSSVSSASSNTPSFNTDYPQKGFVHKVEKGETVSSIAKKYQSKVDWIINANQIADPKKVFVGKELFVPSKVNFNFIMASRLGRGLGGLIAGGASTSSESQDKETIPVQFAPEVKEDSSAVEFSTPAPVSEMESSSATTGMFEISMDSIDPNPFQPRKVMDPETVRELANSIESEGLLQPIVVRLVKDRHQLIAGEREMAGDQLLNRDKITARIIEVDDGASASLALIENLQREDLNPIDEAMGFHSLVDDFDLTQAQVAERVGKSRV